MSPSSHPRRSIPFNGTNHLPLPPPSLVLSICKKVPSGVCAVSAGRSSLRIRLLTAKKRPIYRRSITRLHGALLALVHIFFFFWLCFFFSLVQLFFEPAEEKNRVLIHSDATTEPARISAVLCLRPLSGGTFSAAKKKKTYFTLDLSTSKKSWKTDTSGRQFQRFFFISETLH